MQYTAGHQLHISRVRAGQVQKSFSFKFQLQFNLNVCTNTFCLKVCCIYMQLNRQVVRLMALA